MRKTSVGNFPRDQKNIEECLEETMRQELEYQGYRILIRSAGRLFAQLFRPGSTKPLPETAVATPAEGLDHLKMLARQLVDADLVRNQPRHST